MLRKFFFIVLLCTACNKTDTSTSAIAEEDTPAVVEDVAVGATEVAVAPTEVPAPAPAVAKPSNPDFRNVTWGMSKEEVKALEKSPFHDTDALPTGSFIRYLDTVAGVQVFAVYIFAGDTLTRAKYMVRESHSNDNDFFLDYDALEKALSNKYGPSEPKVNWKGDLFKDDRSKWGLAVSSGDLTVSQRWVTPRTNIFLYLTGDNYTVKLGVEYDSVEYEGFEEKLMEQQNQEKL